MFDVHEESGALLQENKIDTFCLQKDRKQKKLLLSKISKAQEGNLLLLYLFSFIYSLLVAGHGQHGTEDQS